MSNGSTVWRTVSSVLLCLLLTISLLPASGAAGGVTNIAGSATGDGDRRGLAAGQNTNWSPARTSVTVEQADGVVTNDSVETGTRAIPRWETGTDGAVRAAPAVNDQQVYVATESGTVVALDTVSGEPLWRFETGGAIRSQPTVAGGKVYAGSADGSVYALDAATGLQEWAFETDAQVFGSPAVSDGTVYAGTFGGRVHAIDANNGTERWNTTTNGAVAATPRPVGEMVVVGQYDGTITAFNAADGSRSWRSSVAGSVLAAPTVANGLVYVGTRAGTAHALDATSGSERWQFSTDAGVYGSITVTNGRALVPSNDNRVYAVGATDGRSRWSYATDAGVLAAPAVVNGTAYVGSTDDTVYGLDVGSGEPRWSVDVGASVRSSPTAVGDTFYAGADDGSVQRFSIVDGGLRIVTDPGTAYVNRSISLYANLPAGTGVETAEWSFDDGSTARGREVTHTFVRPGSRTVQLRVETEDGRQRTTQRTVRVRPGAPSDLTVSLVPVVNGVRTDSVTIPSGLDLNVTYRAKVTGDDQIKNVTFEVGDRVEVDSTRADGWSVSLDAENLLTPVNLTATAYTPEGGRAVAGRTVSVVESAPWLLELGVAGVGETLREPVVTLEGSFPRDGAIPIPIPDRVPYTEVEMPVVGSEQTVTTNVTVQLQLNLRTTDGSVQIGGSSSYDLGPTEIDGAVTGTAGFVLSDMDLRSARLGLVLESRNNTIPASGLPVPPVGPVPPGAIRIYPVFGAGVDAGLNFDENDRPSGPDPLAFEFTGGTVEPDVSARQEIGQKWQAAEIVAGFAESINATIPLPETDIRDGAVSGEVFARASLLGFTTRVSYPTGSDRFIYSFGGRSGANAVADGVVATDEGWRVRSPTGERPPAASSGSESAANSSVPVESQRVVENAKITDDRVADKEPSLARRPDGSLLVWSRQDPDKSALNGRDVYAATASEGLSFDAPTPVTDDEVADYAPAVATAGNETVAAFTTIDRTFDPANVSEPADLYPYGEIRTARTTGEGWTPPTALTDDDDFDYDPVVTASDGGWTIAWTSDADLNLSTWRDRSVEYVRYENGSYGRIRSIERARAPKLARGPSGVRLAVLRMEGGAATGNITVHSLADETRITGTPVDGFRALAAAGDTVAVATRGTDAWVTVIRNGTTRRLSAPGGAAIPQSVGLAARDDRTLLTARASTPGSRVSRAYYRPRIDDQWLPARTYADGSERNITYWQPTTIARAEGFDSVLIGKELGTEQRHDLYGFRTAFRPDIDVDIEPNRSTAPVGTPVRVNYTVSNIGELAAPSAALRPIDDEATAAIPLRGLGPGENVTGSFVRAVNDSGRLGVRVDFDRPVEQHNTTNDQAITVLQRPNLAVADLSVVRSDQRANVTATVRNPTNVTAPSVPFQLRLGPNLTRTGTVPSVTAGERQQVSVTVPVGVLRNSTAIFRIDPEEATPLTNRGDDSLSRPLVEPDLELSADRVGYFERNGTTVASVSLSNRGAAAASGRLVFVSSRTDSRVTSRTFRIDGANGSEQVFGQFTAELPGVSVNDTLRVAAVTGDSVVASTVDRVDFDSTLSPPSGRIATNRSAPTADGPVGLNAAATDVDGSVVAYRWNVTGGVAETNGSTAVVRPAENASDLTVEVLLVDDDGLRTALSRTLPVDGRSEPGRNATLVTGVQNVGAPARVTVDLGNLTGVDSVSVLREGETVASRSAPEGADTTISWTPIRSSWNATRGSYDSTTLTVVVVGEQDSRQELSVRAPVYRAGDVNGDGAVDVFDAAALGAAFGSTTGDDDYDPAADLNNDGAVDILDAVPIGRNWREQPPGARDTGNTTAR